MRIRKLNHSVYQTQYHIVFRTKYRRKILKPYVKTELFKSFYRIQKRFPDWYFHTINTDLDHVHLQVEFPPTYTIAEVVQKLKTQSAKDLRKRFQYLDHIYYGFDGIWSPGYFVSTIGLDEEKIRKYIEMQGQDDVGVDVSSEFS